MLIVRLLKLERLEMDYNSVAQRCRGNAKHLCERKNKYAPNSVRFKADVCRYFCLSIFCLCQDLVSLQSITSPIPVSVKKNKK